MPRLSSKDTVQKSKPSKSRKNVPRKLPNSAVRKLESVRRKQRKIFLARV